MSENETPSTEKDEQDAAAASTVAAQDQKPTAHFSLLSKTLGFGQCIMDSLNFKNLFKLYVLWELLSGASSWFFPSRSSKEKAAYHLPGAQQHFMLEPVGFAPSSFKQKAGYYEKDIAMWKAMERVVSTEAPNTSYTADGANNTTARITPGIDLLSCTEGLSQAKQEDSPKKIARNLRESPGTVIVIDLHPGAKLQREIKFIRDAVTFLIGMVRNHRAAGRSTRFEAMIVLEASGGSVSAYGLLAEQLRRLRTEPGITLTISCDRTALSGGYMLASLASPGHLFAAPFASIGSLSATTTEILNFHDALENWGIKPIRFRGGKLKNPMSIFDDISEEELEHMQEHIDSYHDAFRDHVMQWRGDTVRDYEVVTSGAYWMGKKAHELGLVDRLTTSDEYVDERVREGDRVLRLTQYGEDKEKGILRFLDYLSPFLPPSEKAHTSEFIFGHKNYDLLEVIKTIRNSLNAIVAFVERAE